MRRRLAWAVVALAGFLFLEAFLPPAAQPTARIAVGLIRAYQAVGSPAMKACGVNCRYTPTCSHYAADAFNAHGTLWGGLKTAGRLWRCSPWGGSGYDPATASLLPSVQQPQNPPPPDRKMRDLTEEEKRAIKEVGAAAGWCAGGCVIAIVAAVGGLAVVIFMMIFVLKDGKARGDTNVALWAVLVWLFPLIGFIIYFVARPKGNLTPCPNCKNARLEVLAKCPHCGVDTGAVKA